MSNTHHQPHPSNPPHRRTAEEPRDDTGDPSQNRDQDTDAADPSKKAPIKGPAAKSVGGEFDGPEETGKGTKKTTRSPDDPDTCCT
jgi:hypothetical protein